MNCRYILIIAFACVLVPSELVAAPLKILVKPSLAQVSSSDRKKRLGLISKAPVSVRVDVLKKNRRSRIITSAGRSMFVRKLRPLGKRRSFPTSGGRVTSITYSGQIRRPGERNSGNFHLTVVSKKGEKAAISASFNSPPFSQNIHQTKAGELILDSFITAEMGACENTPDQSSHKHSDSPARSNDGVNAIANDGEITIDVAILLTSELVTGYGSLSAAVAEATNAVAAANTAYSNSEILQQLSLVYVGQTTTAQGDNMGDDLDRLQSSIDGAFDEAHTIRDEYSADLVSLFWYEPDPSGCGVAYVMTPSDINQGFAQLAFSVVMAECATGNYTFAHELGHNMGATHDSDNAGGIPPAYAYSYGHNFTGTNSSHYRTVMAYAHDDRPGETRIPNFSNPDVTFQGTATGTSSANNALTLNNTASVIAAFRVGGDATPTPTPTPTPEATATPLPSLVFDKVKVATVGKNVKKCSISGGVKFETGDVAPSLPTELQRTSGDILRSSPTSGDGKFNFKIARTKTALKKRYKVVVNKGVVNSTVSRTLRCR